ncbi:hypothetical protein A7982_13069 [Minicystis rosea]|nr:hypothetical protein A7982_13069 [Minicystis rosea]
MRTTLLAMALGGVLLACGGKVAVDGSFSGTGGSTGGAGGNGVGGTTATGPLTCDFLCGGPIGLCGCSGPCSDGKLRGIACGGSTPIGVGCECIVDDVSLGMCDSPTLTCQLAGSCCEALFNK